VACNMPSRGETLEFAVATGKRLAELLGLADRLLGEKEYGKVEGLLEAGETCSLYILARRNEATHLCIECDSGEYAGDSGLSRLVRLARNEISRGYIEIASLTRSAYELDAESSPHARLSSPIRIGSLASARPVEATLRASRATPGMEGQGREAAAHRADMDRQAGQGMSAEELASLLTDLVYYSRLETASRNPLALLERALEMSRGDHDAFYRVMIKLADDRIINVFVYKGRICSAIIIEPGGLRAHFTREDPRKLLANQASSDIRNGFLYKVQCDTCKNLILGPCDSEPLERRGLAPKRKEISRSTEKRRRRLLSLLLRRR